MRQEPFEDSPKTCFVSKWSGTLTTLIPYMETKLSYTENSSNHSESALRMDIAGK